MKPRRKPAALRKPDAFPTANVLTGLDGQSMAVTGVADLPELRQSYELARAALAAQPCRMIIAGQLVTLFQTYLMNTPRRSAESR